MRPVSITALRGLLLCAVMALAACGQIPSAPAAATQVDAIGTPPTSSIYIGNSFFYFNNGITSHVGPLIAAGMPGFRHRSTMVTISGSGADWHDVAS